MDTEYSHFGRSDGETDEMQPDVVWEGIAKLFDYQQLASTWPLSPNSEGHRGDLVDWLESSDEASVSPPQDGLVLQLTGLSYDQPSPSSSKHRPPVPEKDDDTSLIWNDIDMGSTGAALHKTISSSSTDSSVPGEHGLKRQRRKQQNRKAQQAYRARQEDRVKQLEEALSKASLQLKQYEEVIEQLRASLDRPRQLS